MRILIAPDKFRGTLTARQAAEAIAAGWRRTRPRDRLDLAPMADGGEGTAEALVDALGGELVRASVHGPLNDPTEASFGVAETAEGRLAIVEMAAASGLALLAPSRRDPRITTTRGTGDLIAASLDRSPDQLVVALGGSATNDGGAGMAQALGVRLLDGSGRDIGPGGVALLELERIDMTALDLRIERIGCVAATDVNNPLTGPLGASAVYGPQKGASAEDVAMLDRALGHLAAVVHRDLGVDLRDEPGAGAAGGLGFGLMAFLGAGVRQGVEVVSDALDLTSRLREVDLVITGEGRLDAGSLHGKVPAGILRLARELSVPAVIACGQAEPDLGLGDVIVVSMADRFGAQAALSDARRCLVTVSEELARRVDELVGGGAVSGAIDRFLEAARGQGIQPDVHRFPEGTKTAADAARAIGCEVGQIVKSLVFIADERPVMAFTSGVNRVDEAKLAAVVGADTTRRASPEEARTATGFAVGGTPPFGHPERLTCVVDHDLLVWDQIWAAAGTPDSVFPLSPADLLRVTGASAAAFTVD